MASQPYNTTWYNETLNFTAPTSRSALLLFTKTLNLYILPVIIVFGIIGNTLSLLVFITSRLKKHSTSVYLAALAIVDTGLLLCLFFIWLGWLGVDVSLNRPLCPVIVYITYVCSFLSVWIVVSFTVERFIVVSRPLRRQQLLRKGHARFVVIILAMIAITAYMMLFWTTGVVSLPNGLRVCTTYPRYKYVLWILTHIDTITTLILPTLIIFIMNGLIVWKMYTSRRAFQERQRSSFLVRDNSIPDNSGLRVLFTSSFVNIVVHSTTLIPRRQSHNASQYFRTTKMLLVVSSVFLLLNLPSHAFRIQLIIRLMFKPDYVQSFTEFGFQQITEFVYYVNFAINFCLYSVCGENFRAELRALLWKIFPCKLRRQRSNDTDTLYHNNCSHNSDNMYQAVMGTSAV